MIYVFDLCFTLSYIVLKDVLKYMHDYNYKVYRSIREIAIWMEFTFILLFFYAAPEHKISEAGVSFFMCVCTKFLFDLLKGSCKRRKNKQSNTEWKKQTK